VTSRTRYSDIAHSPSDITHSFGDITRSFGDITHSFGESRTRSKMNGVWDVMEVAAGLACCRLMKANYINGIVAPVHAAG
jgi:hypothetical protein